MRELLLQFENLLRKRVDLGVLFVNLLCQSFKLRGLRSIFLRAARDSPQKQSKARKSLLRRKYRLLSSQRNFATGTFI